MQPMPTLLPGQTMDEVAIYVTIANAGAELTLGLYTVATIGNELYADTLVNTLGTVDGSTTGKKSIVGLDFTLPTTEENMYFVGVLQTGGTGGVQIAGPKNTLTPVLYGALNSGIQNRGMSWRKSGITSLPTTISRTEWLAYADVSTLAYVGVR